MSPTSIPSRPCLSFFVLCFLSSLSLERVDPSWRITWGFLDHGQGPWRMSSPSREREGHLFPPELLRLDSVVAKSFLMATYVPQLVKVICKSVFLPLESTGSYQKASFSTIKFLTGFIMQRYCFSSIALCIHLWIQKFKYQGSFLWMFFLNLCSVFESMICTFWFFTLENIWVMLRKKHRE